MHPIGMSYLTLPLLLALTVPVFAQQPQPPHTLAEMRDRYRVLLVFAPQGLDTRFRTQYAKLDGKAMAERDLVAIAGLAKWKEGDEEFSNTHAPFSTPSEQQSLRLRFHIHPNDFTVILLGKDGGEKFRSHTPVTIDQLNRVIDAMPMRQSEMRARNPH